MKNVIKEVDEEELYQHVHKLEGVRHPVENPESLNAAADYIKSTFEEYGLETKEHTFKVEGFDFDFRNIEGYIGDDSEEELLITSHYDTTPITPGADDNASAVAGMLESARVLAQEQNASKIRFVSFTQEEVHPTIALKLKKAAQESGLFDQHDKSLTYHTQKMYKKYIDGFMIGRQKHAGYDEAFQYAIDQLEPELSPKEKEYFQGLADMYKGITRTNFPGNAYLIGSKEWVKAALNEKKRIKGVLNLEMIGFKATHKNSQQLPALLHPLLFPTYKIKPFKVKGDFIAVTSDKNSKLLGKTFFKQCKHDLIKLPCFWARIPMRFEKIANNIYIILLSDHTSFWQENIPAVMITDTSFLRNPFYHTKADTIETLDFDFMKKVTQATVATAIEMNKN